MEKTYLLDGKSKQTSRPMWNPYMPVKQRLMRVGRFISPITVTVCFSKVENIKIHFISLSAVVMVLSVVASKCLQHVSQSSKD